MLLGMIMMLNVWGVIWRNQKIVLANAANVLAGGAADPTRLRPDARRSWRLGRTRSSPCRCCSSWCSRGTPRPVRDCSAAARSGASGSSRSIIIVVIELNALGLMPWKTTANKGLNALYDGPGVRNPLIGAFGLWVVFLILSEMLLKS